MSSPFPEESPSMPLLSPVCLPAVLWHAGRPDLQRERRFRLPRVAVAAGAFVSPDLASHGLRHGRGARTAFARRGPRTGGPTLAAQTSGRTCTSTLWGANSIGEADFDAVGRACGAGRKRLITQGRQRPTCLAVCCRGRAALPLGNGRPAERLREALGSFRPLRSATRSPAHRRRTRVGQAEWTRPRAPFFPPARAEEVLADQQPVPPVLNAERRTGEVAVLGRHGRCRRGGLSGPR
jgi:hypothetical protein